jgi:hypothetical protein
MSGGIVGSIFPDFLDASLANGFRRVPWNQSSTVRITISYRSHLIILGHFYCASAVLADAGKSQQVQLANEAFIGTPCLTRYSFPAFWFIKKPAPG